MRVVFGGLNPSKAGWPESDLTVTKLVEFSVRICGARTLFEAANGEGAGADMPVTIESGGAVFSEDGLYRYRLWRVLDTPCRRVRFDIVNLSAWISTDPDGLFKTEGHDPFGPDNIRHIDDALREADIAIAAWGSLASLPAWFRYQGETVLRAFSRMHDVQCLGKTKDGSPRHPSRIAYSTPLELFRARRAAA